jgi:hypothetical protein
MWTNGCKVGEFFRTDFSKRCCAQILNEVFNSSARGVGSIVPAGEGGDDMGPTQFRSADPSDVLEISHCP